MKNFLESETSAGKTEKNAKGRSLGFNNTIQKEGKYLRYLLSKWLWYFYSRSKVSAMLSDYVLNSLWKNREDICNQPEHFFKHMVKS